MLRIPEFGMVIDAPQDHGLAKSGGVTLYAPLHGRFGLGITTPKPGDDPQGNLDDQYELMAALGPVGDHGATFINRRDPQMPFVGAIRNPHTSQLYLLVPFNHKGLAENDLRRETATLVKWIRFSSPRMSLWEDVLRGRTFTAAHHYQRYIGSSDSNSLEETITFKADGMYLRRITGHTSISSGGLSLGRVRDDRETGLWDILEEGSEIHLRLETTTGDRTALPLSRTTDTYHFGDKSYVRTA